MQYAYLNNDKPWCSTKVNEDGEHVGKQGNWGDCGPECPVEEGKYSKARLIQALTEKSSIGITVQFLAGH